MSHVAVHLVNLTMLAAVDLYLNRRRLCDRRMWKAARHGLKEVFWAFVASFVCLEFPFHPVPIHWFWF